WWRSGGRGWAAAWRGGCPRSASAACPARRRRWPPPTASSTASARRRSWRCCERIADVDHLIRYGGEFFDETIVRAEGSWLETASGRRVLDFTAGQICATIGHNHPRVTEAIRRACDEVIHLNAWMLSPPVLELAGALVATLP